MNVIVIGAGEVGFDVARMLEHERHDVTVLDVDADALERTRDRLDVLTLQGSGTSAALLQEAGVEKADIVVAVTAVDEVNLVACMLAARMDVKTTVARVRSDELASTRSVINAEDFGINLLIHPEESAAAEIIRLIRRASATDVVPFADERLQLVGMRMAPDSPVQGLTLRELGERSDGTPFRVMGVVRGARTLIPRGDERLLAKDQVFVLARSKEMQRVSRAFGHDDLRIKNVMILGGTAVGAKVAMQLAHQKGTRVKLIDPRPSVCQDLAEELPGVLVIQGDATELDLLAAEGIGEMDAFVAVTPDEESNLVSCLLAKHLGVKKTIALLSKGAYVPISQTIGLDAAVSQKLAVAREVARFLRGTHVRSVATVHGLDAEILEIRAEPRSPAVLKPLRDLKVPDGMLIGAVLHNDRTEVATGDTHIEAGDRAIVFVLPGAVEKAERFFDKR